MEIEINKKSKKDYLTIPKKALIGIAPAIAISAILISKKDIGPLILFFVGISAGVLIAKGYFKN
ncbi:hypothetical protein KJ603_01485 [Patescibacteria group bacterium]|nr:hypothetical protein [Patescibacteria group bacterium]